MIHNHLFADVQHCSAT